MAGTIRTKRFLQNLVTSVGGQLLSILLQFVSRTVFIYVLGVQYLGISGLFSNIISAHEFIMLLEEKKVTKNMTDEMYYQYKRITK